MNQTVMVGRLVSDPEIIETDDGKKVTNLVVAVQRTYKNVDGEYETDFIDCTLWNGMAQNVNEYCKKGDVVGIKGRIQTDTYEKDGEKRKVQKVVAEKVTFLSSKSKIDEREQEREESKEDLTVSKETPIVTDEPVKTKRQKKQLEPEMA